MLKWFLNQNQVRVSSPHSDKVLVKSTRKVASNMLTPIPELEFNISHFPLTPEILSSFLALIRSEGGSPILPQWLLTELKARTLKVLSNFSAHPSTIPLLSQEPGTGYLTPLIRLAQSAKPSARLQSLEEQSVRLSEMLWDKVTKPRIDGEDTKVKQMSDILPHFPYCQMAEVLPSRWNSNKLQGFIFRNDQRRVEYVGFEPNPLGRRSYISRAPPAAQEVLVIANAPIPSSVPEYYFEITIDQAESNGSLIR